jgi:hypothetical protein
MFCQKSLDFIGSPCRAIKESSAAILIVLCIGGPKVASSLRRPERSLVAFLCAGFIWHWLNPLF